MRLPLSSALVALLAALTAPEPVRAAGDPAEGQKIAELHCSRCHVIGEQNRMGGIGSTPSFPLLRRMDDWRERFESFYARRPHPVHVRVEGIPKWSDLPSNAAEFRLTLDDVDHILAFVETLPAKR